MQEIEQRRSLLPRITISFNHPIATWMWYMSILHDYKDIGGRVTHGAVTEGQI